MARRQFNPEENRLDYSQMLCPPPGYDLEFAVGMTYSLDMEALLGVPVSLGMFEDYDSSATQNPFFLLEAIRKCSDKLAIFCNADGIKMPQNIRPVYALLENSIFPVSLERNANFHPKLWVIKYHSETEAAVIKVIVLSRNLTFDRSMDIAVEVTGTIGQETKEENRPLADMLYFVKKYAVAGKQNAISSLARDVLRVKKFQCEDPFESCRFLPFGIPRYKSQASQMVDDAQSLIVVSPFLSDSVVERLGNGPYETTLVTRLNSVTQKYELTISCGRLQKPAEIAPIYRSASFVPLQDKVEFHNMLLRELCELYVIRRGNQYCIAKIPTEGIPEDRDSAIYNAVIGSKSGFLAYVAFLLADNYTEAGIEQQELMKRLAIGADTTETVIPSALYERLLRTAAFYPKRLDEVEKIMERVSPELVDDSFRMLIRTFREAVKRR